MFAPIVHLMLRGHEPPHDRLGVEHHPAAPYAGRRDPVEVRVCSLGKEAGGCSSAPPEPVESDSGQQLIRAAWGSTCSQDRHHGCRGPQHPRPTQVSCAEQIRRSLINFVQVEAAMVDQDHQGLPVGLTDPLAARLRGPSQTQQCGGFPRSTLGNRTADAKMHV
jgi:hypothetical protein